MKRREAMGALASGLIGVSAGCLSSSSSVSPKELPKRPGSLDALSAVDYVVEYEEARGHNERYAGRDDLMSYGYRCDGTLETETERAYYVIVQCGYSEEKEEDGVRSAGEGVTHPILYYVTSDDLVRSPTVIVRAETNSESDAPYGIRLVNLSDDDRSVGLDIAYAGQAGNSEPERWFSDTFDLDAKSGYTLEQLTGPVGVYTVSVNPDNGPTKTHNWTVPGQQGPDTTQGRSHTNVNLGVYITPTNETRLLPLNPRSV